MLVCVGVRIEGIRKTTPRKKNSVICRVPIKTNSCDDSTYIDSSINHHSRTTKLPTKTGRKSCA